MTYILFIELPIKWMVKMYINTYTYNFAVFWRLWSYLELGENDPDNVKSESGIWSSVGRHSCCTNNASSMIFSRNWTLFQKFPIFSQEFMIFYHILCFLKPYYYGYFILVLGRN